MKRKKTTSIPLKILRIEHDGLHLLVMAKINGKNARLIVDTGASRTVFDKKRIQKFVKDKKFKKHEGISTGLGTNSMESHVVKIDKIEIGKLVLNEFVFVLLDLSHVNSSYAQIGMKEIDGVLGGDILMNHKAVIDYGKKKISLNLD
ncbi:MAG: retropepsin-like aspartic protease [Bacteroidia bacterium]